jgi:hypothetical protein
MTFNPAPQAPQNQGNSRGQSPRNQRNTYARFDLGFVYQVGGLTVGRTAVAKQMTIAGKAG